METYIMQTLELTYSQRDKKVIWHPWNLSHAQPHLPIAIIKGEGAHVFDSNGEAYLDGTSSWWVNLHGHCHPYISEQIIKQLNELEHVMFNEFTHPIGINYAEKLLNALPEGYSRVFYSDNGSTAVEAALKIAIQYWHNLDPNNPRKTIIALKGGFHGETFGSMSVSEKNATNRPFWSYLFNVQFVDPPTKGKEENTLTQLRQILKSYPTAALIFEPFVQGAGGMRVFSAEVLDQMIECCKKEGVLIIADEVMTGFGRLGPHFASSLLQRQPDIICLSKGITGGFLPLGATVCREYLYQAFHTAEKFHTFLHGHSYAGNPLACAAALASLELLEKDECTKQRLEIALGHKKFCNQWGSHPALKRCESFGTLLIVEYQTKENFFYFSGIRDKLINYFLQNHVLIRPIGNVLYFMPPYCISKDDLEMVYGLIINTLEDIYE